MLKTGNPRVTILEYIEECCGYCIPMIISKEQMADPAWQKYTAFRPIFAHKEALTLYRITSLQL